jgi:MtN3 and saliva related transmembrane protein
MTLAIGLLAAALTIASFVAQVAKILRTRDTRAISTPMWILSIVAFAGWIVYGVRIAAWPVIVPNAVCLVLAGVILVLKLLPARARERVADKVT